MAAPAPPALVIDCGTATTRIGLAGGPHVPSLIIPTEVGRAAGMTQSATDIAEAAMAELAGLSKKKAEVWIGEDITANSVTLEISCPVVNGRVNNWDDMEQLWEAAIGAKLGLDSKHHPIVLIESPMIVKADREALLKILFESLGAPAVYLASSAVMALYANNMTTGLVVSCGESTGHVVPVLDCYTKRYNIQPLDICGATLTAFMQHELGKKNVRGGINDIQARLIKQALCLVSENFDRATATAASSPSFEEAYSLPDGRLVVVSQERFRVPELGFRPDMEPAFWQDKPPSPAWQEQVAATLSCYKEEERAELARNILFTGGSLSIKGMQARMQSEVVAATADLLPGPESVCVRAPLWGGLVDAWKGGSLVASMSHFTELCIHKSLYEEVGVDIAYSRCL